VIVKPTAITTHAVRLYRDHHRESWTLLDADRELRQQLGRAKFIEDRPSGAVWQTPRGELLVVNQRGVVVGVLERT
jgi:hypothetical protein